MANFIQSAMRITTLLVTSMAMCAVDGAQVAEVWEGQPYHINASLAVDAPGDLAGQLATELPNYLRERANTSIGSVWRLDVEPVSGALRHKLLQSHKSPADSDLPEPKGDEDKRLLLAVRATPWGYELSAREFDRYLRRWGPRIEQTVRQREAVPEHLFSLAERAVAPLAHFEPDANDPQEVKIELRGADLPLSGAGDFRWLEPGDVLQPQLVLKTRDGATAPNGVSVIPWTYIEVSEPKEGSTRLVGRVRSATARPFGARRGKVEQVAIGMRHDREESTLVLRSRAEPDKPLAGYEVSSQSGDAKKMERIGQSDARGEVRIPPGRAGVQMLYLKSGGVTLARLPIVPGAETLVTVPLPDDEVRLRAAARLAALREDIVDVVARRTIFMARVRQEIQDQNFEMARELLKSLDALPGTTQFRISMDRDAQMLQTKDPQVQRRIDKLFGETRSVLGKFLNPQPIGALHEELRQAELQQQEPQESNAASSADT